MVFVDIAILTVLKALILDVKNALMDFMLMLKENVRNYLHTALSQTFKQEIVLNARKASIYIHQEDALRPLKYRIAKYMIQWTKKSVLSVLLAIFPKTQVAKKSLLYVRTITLKLESAWIARTQD